MSSLVKIYSVTQLVLFSKIRRAMSNPNAKSVLLRHRAEYGAVLKPWLCIQQVILCKYSEPRYAFPNNKTSILSQKIYLITMQ